MPITKTHIRELRTKAELTQEQLGEALGVTRQTINAIEQGKYEPSITLAFKCSRYFKAPIEKLFIYED